MAVWLYAGTFPDLPEGHPGPGLFPRVIAAALTLSGLLLLWQGLRHRAEEADKPPPDGRRQAGLGRLGLGLGLVVLYPLGQAVLGFIPTLTIIALGVALILRVRPVVAVGVALGSAVLIYGLFTGLLGVPLS